MITEVTCTTCGQRFHTANPSTVCPVCTLAAIAEQTNVPPPTDTAFAAGDPPISSPHEDIRVGTPTAAGCVLVIVSVAVIFGTAIPIVTWRDPETGAPLPRMVAILLPVLAGALCYGLGSGVLKLLGLPIFAKPVNSPRDLEHHP